MVKTLRIIVSTIQLPIFLWGFIAYLTNALTNLEYLYHI